MNEEVDQKVFNKVMDFADILIDKKYVSAWFSWIEWCTLTAILFVVARTSSSAIIYTASILSVFCLVIVGMAACNRLFKDILSAELNFSGWCYFLLFIPLFATPAIVITIVQAVISVLGE